MPNLIENYTKIDLLRNRSKPSKFIIFEKLLVCHIKKEAKLKWVIVTYHLGTHFLGPIYRYGKQKNDVFKVQNLLTLQLKKYA